MGLDSFNHLAAERTLVNQLTGLMKVQSSADLPEKINQPQPAASRGAAEPVPSQQPSA